MLEPGDNGSNLAPRAFERVTPPGDHGTVIEPNDVPRNFIGNDWCCVRRSQNVASADIDFVSQNNGDGLPFGGNLSLPIGREDPGDLTHATGGERCNGVALANNPIRHAAAEAAKVGVRTVDPLDRETERKVLEFRQYLNILEMLDDGRADVPRHCFAARKDIVTIASTDGNAGNVRNADPRSHIAVIVDN